MDWNSSEESTPPGTTLVRGFKLSARDSLASVPPCLRGSGHDEFQGTPACWFGVGVKGTRCCPVCRNGLSGKLCGWPQTKGKIGHHHSGSLGDSYRCCLLFPFLFVLVHGSGVGIVSLSHCVLSGYWFRLSHNSVHNLYLFSTLCWEHFLSVSLLYTYNYLWMFSFGTILFVLQGEENAH